MSFERMGMHIIAVALFLYALAVLFGIFEIEAEGKYGWGEKFPTWYRVNTKAAKVYGMFTSKPLTGYHAALFFVPIMIFLWPMVATSTITLHGVVGAFSLYFAWVVVWDFTWFVLNPHFGVARFKRSNVWWFSKEPWLGLVPSGYISAWVISLVLAGVGGGLKGGWLNGLVDQALQLLVYVACISFLIILGAPMYSRYYNRMRQYDERNQAGIFHNQDS